MYVLQQDDMKSISGHAALLMIYLQLIHQQDAMEWKLMDVYHENLENLQCTTCFYRWKPQWQDKEL